MTEKKGGELAELKTQLRALAASQQKESVQIKRELFKKIILYMTINIDVSSLFGEMIMATVTTDIAIKKMLYHYITYHAHVHPELALLSINTLLKDCRDEAPLIRGLALRNLCSLRVPNLIEYLTEPLQRALSDKHAYVRRTATIAVLKIYDLDKAAITDLGILDTVRGIAISDRDAQVAVNAVSVIAEIEGKESLANAGMLIPLLNRVKELDEWGLCLVMEIAALYVPKESEEVFDMMNVLESCLAHVNSAVVLATVRVFLRITLSMAEVHQQVYERIKAPLLTLISSSVPEVAYAVVAHLHLLVCRVPVLFAQDHKHFYCRYSDPSYIKQLKLEMLTAVADSNNVFPIVVELSEYAADVDIAIARKSIAAVGQIALETPDAEAIVMRLLQFLELEQQHITCETLVVLKDLLRRHPKHTMDITNALNLVDISAVEEPAAKAAYIWMVGELGTLDPYLLEPLVAAFAEETSAGVRLELLTACAKLFFMRPPECQLQLAQVLKAGVEDSHQDVHDRALLYYRLLEHSPDEARRVITSEQGTTLGSFAETHNTDLLDGLFDEFNTLAVLYQKPSYTFTDSAHDNASTDMQQDMLGADVPLAEAERPLPVALDAAETDLLGEELREDATPASATDPLGPSSYTAPSADALAQLLDMSSGNSDPFAPSSLAPPSLQLHPQPVLDAATFQRKWGALAGSAETSSVTEGAANSLALVGVAPVKQAMLAHSIQTMASGGQAPQFKFFFYGQPSGEGPGGAHLLVEMVVNTAARQAAVTLKSDAHQALHGPFIEKVKSILAGVL